MCRLVRLQGLLRLMAILQGLMRLLALLQGLMRLLVRCLHQMYWTLLCPDLMRPLMDILDLIRQLHMEILRPRVLGLKQLKDIGVMMVNGFQAFVHGKNPRAERGQEEVRQTNRPSTRGGKIERLDFVLFSGTAAFLFVEFYVYICRLEFHTLHWSHCRISTWILFSMMYPQRFNSTGLFFPEKKVDTCHSFRFSFAVVLCTYHAKEIGAISSLDCVFFSFKSWYCEDIGCCWVPWLYIHGKKEKDHWCHVCLYFQLFREEYINIIYHHSSIMWDWFLTIWCVFFSNQMFKFYFVIFKWFWIQNIDHVNFETFCQEVQKKKIFNQCNDGFKYFCNYQNVSSSTFLK